MYKKVWCEDVDWFHVAQDADQWQALVNTVMDMAVIWVFEPLSGRSPC
jgi:hypothetical protein